MMKIRPVAFALTAVVLILCSALHAFSQQASDRGFLAGKKVDLKGPAPRLPNGKPDLGGVWDRPAVDDITKSFTSPEGLRQVGEPKLLFTDWGKKKFEAYEPQNDYAGACLPYGFPRAIAGRHPLQLVQSNDFLAFLFEQNSWFTVVPIDGRPHPKDAMGNPSWFGNSVGRWDGDTLVIDTIAVNGYTMLDYSHPHSTQLHLIQKFTRTDFGHIEYEMIVEDPKTYTAPIKNVRTFVLKPGWETMEYSCEENNLELIRNGTIKWQPPEID
ncbi:MAG TPA: hypothetical protein VE422_09900 [Terriglobia bacterium]|nr:hypothetical protein [Terriglobia bacterium]